LGATLWISLAVGTPARASVVLALTDADLTRGADLIVRGQVVAARSRMGDRSIVTDYVLRVEERLKGDAGDTVVVTELGGRIGETRHVVPGAPAYRVGAHVLAYLFRHGTELSTLGMAQGLFVVQAVPDTGEEILVRTLVETTLASTDADGVVRPHAAATQATEAPRRLADMRELALRLVPRAR
jgi:hypothetical protein